MALASAATARVLTEGVGTATEALAVAGIAVARTMGTGAETLALAIAAGALIETPPAPVLIVGSGAVAVD
jgi:hypothetical protein